MNNILYLHIGCGKTGTSALQVWLSDNSELLFNEGVLYPTFDQTITDINQITSGNGIYLINCLKNGNAIELLRDLFQEKINKVLFSSENFQDLSDDEISELVLVTKNLDIEVKVIAYIRDVYEIFYSGYMHLAKRHGLSANIFDYEKITINLQQFDTVDRWSRFVNEIRVVHYDSCKNELDIPIMNELNIGGNVIPKISSKVINRSLTILEADFVRSINHNLMTKFDFFPADFTKLVTNKILSRYPERSTPIFYYSKIIESLDYKFNSTIARYNSIYFDGQIVLKLHNDNVVLDKAPNAEDFTAIASDVLDAFFETIDSFIFDGVSVDKARQRSSNDALQL